MGRDRHGGEAPQGTQEAETDRGPHGSEGAPGGHDGAGPSGVHDESPQGVGTMHVQGGGDAPRITHPTSQE